MTRQPKHGSTPTEKLYELLDGRPTSLQYYVERPDRSMELLATGLTFEKYRKYLLAGQNGTGKTTELRKLATLVQNKFVVVNADSRDIVDPLRFDEIEFLLGVVSALLRTAKDWGVSLDIQSRKSKAFKASIAFAGLKIEERRDLKSQVREARVDLLQDVNNALTMFSSITQMPILLIFDELEKSNPDGISDVLSRYTSYFADLPCAAVFTVDPRVLFDASLHAQVTDRFEIVNIACVPPRKRHGGLNRESVDFLRQVLIARGLKTEMYERTVDLKAILASGGHLRQLMRIWRRALELTIVNSRERIGLRELEQALAIERTTFKRLLRHDDYNTLRWVYEEKALRPEFGTHLIQILAAFEYSERSGEGWFDVNPIVADLLDLDGVSVGEGRP